MPCAFRFLLPRGGLAKISLPCLLFILLADPSPVEAEPILIDRADICYDQRPSRLRSWRGEIKRRRNVRRGRFKRKSLRRRHVQRLRPKARTSRLAHRPAIRRPAAHRSLTPRSRPHRVRSVVKRRSHRSPSRLAHVRKGPRATKPAAPRARSTIATTPRPERPPLRVRDTLARAPRAITPKQPATTTRATTPKPAPSKPVVEGYRPNSPWASANRWRGLARRSIAEERPGLAARVEVYPGLAMLLQSLPDDGEMRVRNGIYIGPNAYAHEERLPEEARHVQVDCWLHGVRQDTSNLRFEGTIELLLGTTSDPASSRFMIAEIPAGRDLPGEPGTFEMARNGLRALIGNYPIEREFRLMIPTSVVVEGSLFFDGWRGALAARQTTGSSAPQPITAWEIQPVVAIRNR